jgi:pimeloyl-ACP methyl ester carboxylesterase
MPVAELNGITMSYDDEGEGVPVVMVHGHPFDRTMWHPQMDILSHSGYRVLVPDLRGYGQTTVVPGATTLDVFATDIVAILDHLELDRVVLAGLSMGGQIVMEFARLFPRRTMGLVLADTTAQAETPASRHTRYQLADQLVVEGMGRYADEVLPMMLSPHDRIPTNDRRTSAL